MDIDYSFLQIFKSLENKLEYFITESQNLLPKDLLRDFIIQANDEEKLLTLKLLSKVSEAEAIETFKNINDIFVETEFWLSYSNI